MQTPVPPVLFPLCLAALCCAFHAAAGTVSVDTLRADEVRTREISLAPFVPEDLALYYAFEENSGATSVDWGPGALDGAVSGCVWTNEGRRVGGAMAYNGLSGSISAGTSLNFPSWSAYTVSLWFLHNGGGDLVGPQYGHKMLDKTSFYHDWYLRLYPKGDYPGHIGLSLYEGGAARGMWDPSSNYMDGVWHHVAVVRNGTLGQFWVDGILKQEVSNMISVTSSSALCVGNSFSTDSYQRKPWSGLLDEIQVYNRALSASEVAALHSGGAPHPVAEAVSVTADLEVHGDLSVTGGASFADGILLMRPLGDLSQGIYTNAP